MAETKLTPPEKAYTKRLLDEKVKELTSKMPESHHKSIQLEAIKLINSRITAKEKAVIINLGLKARRLKEEVEKLYAKERNLMNKLNSRFPEMLPGTRDIVCENYCLFDFSKPSYNFLTGLADFHSKKLEVELDKKVLMLENKINGYAGGFDVEQFHKDLASL